MRNFYMKSMVDGRKTPITGGPRSKDGGMFITLYQKEKGESVEVLSVVSTVLPNGNLKTVVRMKGVDEPKVIITEP